MNRRMPNGTYWWCERGDLISPTRLIDSYPKTFKNPNCVLCCYKKLEEDKHRLVIKPEEAKAVREIGISIRHLAVAKVK